jgi:hypothetical protein
MAIPPLAPEAVRSKALAWLKMGNTQFLQDAVLFYVRVGLTEAYIEDCLLEHFESCRKVFRKWNEPDGRMFGEEVMSLNLEVQDFNTEGVYVIIEAKNTRLYVKNIHTHTTLRLPR